MVDSISFQTILCVVYVLLCRLEMLIMKYRVADTDNMLLFLMHFPIVCVPI